MGQSNMENHFQAIEQELQVEEQEISDQ